MDFVGIRPFAEKKRLLTEGKTDVTEVSTRDLTFDCIRHLEFLRAVSDGIEDSGLPETLYWKYLEVESRRPREAVLQRCHRFISLFRKILAEGLDYSKGYIAVTSDGMRLDGSHRAAIACFMGLERVSVLMYRWDQFFAPRRIRRIAEEAQVKREVQLRYLGKTVEDPATGTCVGKVVIAHAVEARRWLFRKSWDPMVVAMNDQGKLTYVRVDSAVIR